MLHGICTAAPCSVSWHDMKGDERIRRCTKCQHPVYFLTDLPPEEVEKFLVTQGARTGKVYLRADGALMTSDCPEGVRHRARRWIASGVALAVVVLVAIAASFWPRPTASQQPKKRPAKNLEPLPNIEDWVEPETPRKGVMRRTQ